jgi:hypothetical protein
MSNNIEIEAAVEVVDLRTMLLSLNRGKQRKKCSKVVLKANQCLRKVNSQEIVKRCGAKSKITIREKLAIQRTSVQLSHTYQKSEMTMVLTSSYL